MNKTLAYLFLNWLLIILSVFLSVSDLLPYPLAVIVIANRLSANYLVGHEAVHGLVIKKSSLNDFIGRYFCHFPIFVSFETYKFYHLWHHKYLGTDLDPDKTLYDFYPLTKKQFVKKIIYEIFSFKMLLNFAFYFTPFFFVFRFRKHPKKIKNDLKSYSLFILVLFSGLTYFSLWKIYLLYWLVPIIFIIPYYYFIGALQHGAVHLRPDPENSRNISGPFLLLEFLLPCSANLHGIHHIHPSIPFYELKNIKGSDQVKYINYMDAVRDLIKTR